MHGGVVRVAIVSPYSWAHPGGVNNHIEGLASQLAGRGHDVTIIAPDEGANAEGVAFVSAGKSIQVRANGSVARLAVRPGTSRRVKKAVASGGFDVVHVHEPLVPSVSRAAVLGSKCRVVATFHTAGEGGSLTYWLGRRLSSNVAGRLDARIAVSEPARARASRYLPGEYEIVPNGVDTSRFRAAGAGAAAADGCEILFVGRNEPRKGLDVLLEAFPLVCDSIDDCRLKVIGSGFTPGSVAGSLPAGLRGRVEVLGFVENDELPSHYAGARVFCAPARGGESFGIVLVEAMASGTPVVASDIPGYSAVIQQAGGGLIFRNGDARDLARALVEVLKDDELRDGLRRKGLAGVEQFSWEVLAPRIEGIYAG
jgi:phosphatidyl-myo-inositol alpha-mannosyltransferase